MPVTFNPLPWCSLLALCWLLTACQQELLKGLDQDQANVVLACLQGYAIPAQKTDMGKAGFRIQVAREDIPAAVEILRNHGLPAQRAPEIASLFPEDALLSSPLAERARLYSAHEQRLAQSLSSLGPVLGARVHISYPLALEASGPIHVAVIVRYQADADSVWLVSEIRRFISNSLNDVDEQDISVVLSPVTFKPTVARPAARTPILQYGLLALVLLAGLLILLIRRRRQRQRVEPAD